MLNYFACVCSSRPMLEDMFQLSLSQHRVSNSCVQDKTETRVLVVPGSRLSYIFMHDKI